MGGWVIIRIECSSRKKIEAHKDVGFFSLLPGLPVFQLCNIYPAIRVSLEKVESSVYLSRWITVS